MSAVDRTFMKTGEASGFSSYNPNIFNHLSSCVQQLCAVVSLTYGGQGLIVNHTYLHHKSLYHPA